MTALTARAPLQHLPMNATQRPARRLSARLQEKEDLPPPSTTAPINGYRHAPTTQQSHAKITTNTNHAPATTANGRKEMTEKEKIGGGRKRKIDYDEEIEGFAFTRGRSKKPKDSAIANASSQPPIVPEEKPRTLEKVSEVERAHAVANQEKKKGRNKMSFSTPKNLVEEKPKARRRSKRLSGETDDQSNREQSPKLKVKKRPKEKLVKELRRGDSAGEAESSQSPPRGTSPTPEDEHSATKIALPFADTPVIRRNKAMREGKADKGERRSSLGMRGRRASSLIDSGMSNALPHSEVDARDFYKHIESSGLSEPRRMRQLLTWCATRAMGEKRSGAEFQDQSARLAARVIQEELLTDLSNRSELSDWFGREDAPPAEISVVRKPNPKNVQNLTKIEELEERIKRLQFERKALEALLRPPSIPPLSTITSSMSNTTSHPQATLSEMAIDTTLLDPCDLTILESVAPDSTASASALSRRINSMTASLRPTVDAFVDGVHQISTYRDAGDRIAGVVLGLCARKLEERDQRRVRDEAGLQGDRGGPRKEKGRGDDDIGPLLRGLSRIDR